MTHRFIACTLFLVLLTNSSFAEVPPRVQADLLERQIVEKLGRDPPSGPEVLSLIARYHSLEATSDIRVPPAILYTEARLAAISDPLRAHKALELYFNRANKAVDASYEGALQLLPEVQRRAANAMVQAKEDHKRAVEDERIRKNFEICEEVNSRLSEYTSENIGWKYGTFAKQRNRCPSPAISLVPESHPQYGRMVALQDSMQSRFLALSADVARKVLMKGVAGAGIADQPLISIAIPPGDLQLRDGRKLHSVGYKITDLALSPCTIQESYLSLADPNYKSEWVPGRGCPVTNQQVSKFVFWLSESTGRRFRLPTEVEWEYAVRAGAVTDYPWGSRHSFGKAEKYGRQKNKFGVSGAWVGYAELTSNCPSSPADALCTTAEYVLRNRPQWGGSGKGRFADRNVVGGSDEAVWFRLVEM